MEKEMTGADRRKKLIFLMRESEQPLSGTQLGQVTGVSRQVVVQDIALLRTEGYPIVSTAKGYLLNEPKCATRAPVPDIECRFHAPVNPVVHHDI